MRWINRGKELEQQAEYIKSSETYIFGAGEIGKTVYEELLRWEQVKVRGFIDNSTAKQGKLYLSEKVYSLNDIIGQENIVLVLAVSENYIEEIRHGIEREFLADAAKQMIYGYQDFLSICYYYFEKHVFFKSLNISLTQKCSLNCINCSVLTPYIRNKKDFPLEELKKDIDIFFDKADYLGALSFVGGEPFLYPYLEEYLEYFMDSYHSRIKFRWNIITNGTIIPSDRVLELIHKFGGNISISDYSNTLPYLEPKIAELIQRLEDKGISYNVGKAKHWIDFGYNGKRKDFSDEKMELFFSKCNMPCRLLQNNKLYYCANARFAQLADMNEADSNNVFDLEGEWKGSELLEFDMGYSEQGYINMCRYCNGYLTVNRNYIEVAKQV